MRDTQNIALDLIISHRVTTTVRTRQLTIIFLELDIENRVYPEINAPRIYYIDKYIKKIFCKFS